MPIPNLFAIAGDGNLTTYQFSDTVRGKGILELYGGDYDDGGTQKYVLSPNAFYGQDGRTQTTGTTGLDIDFDVEIGKPFILDGDCIVTMQCRVQTAGANTVTMQAKLRKVVSAVESEIADDTASHSATFGSNQIQGFCVRFDVPRTSFAIGDILRISIITTNANSATIDWFHDPKNRSTINGGSYGVEFSQMTAQLSVSLDL